MRQRNQPFAFSPKSIIDLFWAFRLCVSSQCSNHETSCLGKKETNHWRQASIPHPLASCQPKWFFFHHLVLQREILQLWDETCPRISTQPAPGALWDRYALVSPSCLGGVACVASWAFG